MRYLNTLPSRFTALSFTGCLSSLPSDRRASRAAPKRGEPVCYVPPIPRPGIRGDQHCNRARRRKRNASTTVQPAGGKATDRGSMLPFSGFAQVAVLG
jgi:hypothetical protein